MSHVDVRATPAEAHAEAVGASVCIPIPFRTVYVARGLPAWSVTWIDIPYVKILEYGIAVLAP